MDPNFIFTREIEKARKAREKGNEGQARVCARRAAGAILSIYFSRQGISVVGLSAYQMMKLFLHQSQIPETARMNVNHLLMQVNEIFQLPAEIDLIQEALALRDQISNL